MEIFELRYFLEVAKFENIHRASQSLRISPGSLSKAVARIEDELKTKLFSREGRNIRLTDHGKLLKSRAAFIVQLEESARMEISGHEGQIRVLIAGPEVLLSKMGLQMTSEIQKRHPQARFEFQACDEDRALEAVTLGEVHLALVTGEVGGELTSRVLTEAKFMTVAGREHPLYVLARSKKSVAIDKVLEYDFVSPSLPILGHVGQKQSHDGWRDDRFLRKVRYLTTSLKLIETLAESGKALAYVPDYYAAQIDVLPIKITGCPYTCSQKIKVVARKSKEIGWLNQLF